MNMSENKEFFISIITPAYNSGKFLEENILSVKNQSYPFIEHIVIDGGSTDNSSEILKKYEKTYNLKWISEKDNGCADAMDKGFKRATGDIYCWLDADDTYLPGTIEKVMNIFQKNPDIDVVFGNCLISDSKGKIIDYRKYTDFDPKALVYTGATFGSQITFWRKDLHNKIGGLDTKYLRASDCDFFIKMSLSGAKFFHLNKFLSVYRRHPGQLTKSFDICKAEVAEISKRYSDKNLTLKQFAWNKKKAVLKRIWYFIKQGDSWYILRSALKRFKIFSINE